MFRQSRMSLSALKISNYFSLPMKIVLQGQSVSSIVKKSVQADSNESDFKAKYEVQDGKVLHAAASIGNTEVIELILSQGFHLDSRNRKGVTPLMTAALNDEQNAFEILIQNGADPSFKDNNGFSVLHSAAQGGNTSIIIKLLSLGLDVDSRNNGGVTPLMTAALNDKQNALTSWYKTVLIHLSKTTTGSVCSTLLRKVEIPPLSASCYHLVLTLIQGTMVGSLYWWLQPSTTNKCFWDLDTKRCWSIFQRQQWVQCAPLCCTRWKYLHYQQAVTTWSVDTFIALLQTHLLKQAYCT